MVFSTEFTAFTKKEKRTKKERKAAAADSLTSYTTLLFIPIRSGEGAAHAASNPEERPKKPARYGKTL
jgi:hypothetical protein